MSVISDEIKRRLEGSSNGFSEDRRQKNHALRTPLGPGPETGTEGDTVFANVTIQTAEVDEQGETLKIIVTFAGNYVRQGYVSPGGFGTVLDPTGTERRALFGKVPVTVVGQLFKPPQVTLGKPYDIGEVADSQHDSNACAVNALFPLIMQAYAA